MKNILPAAILLSFATSVAFAGPAKERGGYVGGALGSTTFDDGGAFAGFDQDDSDSGFSVFGGYKFLKHLAVEARYTDFGTFTVSLIPLDASVASVHAVGIIPFGSSGWELFGQLGFGTLDVSLPDATTDNEIVGSAGLGVRFSASENFSIALQMDAYAYEDTSLGVSYDIGFTATSVSLQYIF